MISKYDIIRNKIVFRKENLSQELNRWHFQNKKIVFTNGCFDILHRGHVEYLAKASDLGDYLVLGLNTDSSIRRIKGENRPVNDEYARAMVIASLSFVTKVVFFDDDTPYELIKFVKPNILVKGDDYKAEDIVGYDIVKENGGEIITVELTQGYSTTKIIEKFKRG